MKALLAIISVLLVASIAGNVYLYNDINNKTTEIDTLNTQLISEQSDLTAAQERMKGDPLVVDAPDGSDADMVALRKAANSAVGGSEDASPAILKVGKKTDKAAAITVTPLKYGAATTGGSQLVMVKKDGVWTKLFGAQQYDPSQDALLEEAGVPADFLKSE